jgi:small multidrug resistance family-3 protein
MNLKIVTVLVMAALLEVGGDALVRGGLQRKGAGLLLAGSLTLAAYGFLVNMTQLDFSRLMGLYIVVFFLVSQAVALLFFREPLGRGVMVGGTIVVLGGVVMTVLG